MKGSLAVVIAGALCAGSGCGAAAQKQPDAAQQRAASIKELIRRGNASARVGDMTRAEQYFVSAQKLGADDKVIVQRLLVVCVAEQRFPVALEYAENYLRKHPNDMDVSFAAASINMAVGNTEQARALLEVVVRERPEWADAHYALASVLRERGEEAGKADQHDLQYLKLAPNGPLAEVARSRLRRSFQ